MEGWNEMCTILGYDDAKLDIDFDTLNRTVSKEEGSEGEGSAKKDDILSLLQSGGTLTLGGLGGPVGISKKKDSEKAGPDTEGGEEGDKKGADGKGKYLERLIPMDPEDLRIIGEGYRNALKAVSEMDGNERDLLYQRILSTMPRAVYSVNNHGHFGLNSLCYTHFTSPIRRYPDVLVHRILAHLIQGNEIDDKQKELLRDDLEVQLDICNDQSKAAENLERGMIDVALAFMFFKTNAGSTK